ncbi:ImmA/IrrE family metallo-endopeptidase [Marinobacter nanhaiticus D15-8W]|nr:XRE family transcriptional regulator [Marinobacter nanhaiticus]BES73035.1 ImmA/IrrE family metallo-endopeptidase [Marinobacter nanhaiticus D15-8W]
MIRAMDKIKGVNPSRILWCCDDLGVSVEELAQETGIALATLEKALEGKEALSVKQLQKLAIHFNRGLLFFLEEGPVSEGRVHSVQFRTLNNQKPQLSRRFRTLVERTERQRLTYLSLREDLGEPVEPGWYPEDLAMNAPQPEQAAQLARTWLGLQPGQSFADMRAAVEAKNILVFLSNGYAGQWQIPKESPIRGFSLYFDSFPVIFIKKQQSEGAQAFTMMHELGHLLLHRESFVDDEDDFHSHSANEVAANWFAGNLLVPERFLEKLDLKSFPGDDVTAYDRFLEDDARRWCVSPEVILRRMMDSGLLPQEDYQAYRRWKQSLPVIERQSSGGSRYRFKEPVRVFGKSYVGTVLDALHEQRITLARASSYLDNLKIADLRQLEDTHAAI